MIGRRAVSVVALVLLALVVGWALFVSLPRRYGPTTVETPAASTAAPSAERRITATLYFISEDGMSLIGVQREVPFGESVVDQARYVVEALLAEAPPPLASPIPPGTALRTLYLTERGDAFVDLTIDARTNHTGGALDELFTVYAIVDALTVNLPAIRRVQILVEGKEVDTLAGHVDLRHPLQQNLQWVRMEKDES